MMSTLTSHLGLFRTLRRELEPIDSRQVASQWTRYSRNRRRKLVPITAPRRMFPSRGCCQEDFIGRHYVLRISRRDEPDTLRTSEPRLYHHAVVFLVSAASSNGECDGLNFDDCCPTTRVASWTPPEKAFIRIPSVIRQSPAAGWRSPRHSSQLLQRTVSSATLSLLG